MAARIGHTNSARNYGFDFDGIQDMIVGYITRTIGVQPSVDHADHDGQWDGTFAAQTEIRDFPLVMAVTLLCRSGVD